jgi:cell division protein ZapB
MNDELGGLEGKVAQVVALCASLRDENVRLRGRVSALEDEKEALAERMSEARMRLEGLMDRLPPE